MLVPKLVTTLRGYTRAAFIGDLTAGVIVGIVALPLAIAFAIASGVPPERGLWTAIVAGGLISLLGGSRVQIGGPTGAFVVIVAGIVAQHGLDGLALATLMAGVMLIAFGLARFGTAITYIPYPVVVGFTSGIAVLIASTQVKDLLGLEIASLPAEFVPKWQALVAALPTASTPAIAIGVGTVLLLAVWPRVSRRIPGPFVALIAGSVAVALLDLPVETIGSRFGAIPSGIPALSFPSVTIDRLRELLLPAATIAMLGAIESLLSAVVADGMIGGRHRSNMELVAQGVANLASPLVGGIPATGAIARTATNVKNGATTPVAGIVHALTLLLITLFAAPLAARVPMATLAGILCVVAYHMSEWRSVRTLLRAPRSDVLVLVVTFALTVLVDLTAAIGAGMVLAAFLFMKRMAEVAHIARLGDDEEDEGGEAGPALPSGVQVYEINGPFFFGAAAAFRHTLDQVSARPSRLVLRMRHVPVIDATGLHALANILRTAKAEGTVVVLAEVQEQPRAAIARAGLGVPMAATVEEAITNGSAPH
ncbi:MAG TPA: sulfate permease [Gemmatimonadales bacterium]|nr:sulfate permease [Gemmatimonadales bacterium]